MLVDAVNVVGVVSWLIERIEFYIFDDRHSSQQCYLCNLRIIEPANNLIQNGD